MRKLIINVIINTFYWLKIDREDSAAVECTASNVLIACARHNAHVLKQIL